MIIWRFRRDSSLYITFSSDSTVVQDSSEYSLDRDISREIHWIEKRKFK